jgi:hypothetical protein
MKISAFLSSTVALLAFGFANPAAAEGPALWKVADEDTTIYLFGTVHALPDNINWYTGEVKSALDASSTLVTEVDMSPESLAKLGPLVNSLAVYKDGTKLRDLMDEGQRADYEAALTKLGIPVEALDSVEPWFAALQLSNAAMGAAGINPANGAEQVLESKLGESVGRGGLETLEFQLGIFDSMPQDAQIRFLVQAARELDEIAPSLQQIIDTWAVGDTDGVAALLNEALAEEPAFAEALLYARNRNWAEWISTRLDTPGTIFMAVGAGHLAGDKSVQAYLLESGIETARVQ